MSDSTEVLKPRSWLLWHPHQGLWNRELLQLIKKSFPRFHKRLEVQVVRLDTLILFLRAFGTRIRTLGITRAFSSTAIPSDVSIVYLDLGTHKEGAELSMAVESILPDLSSNFVAYGFEASPQSYGHIQAKFREHPSVHIVQKALCHVVPPGGKLRLYLDGRRGEGNSIHRRSAEYEDVEAIRLSDFLLANGLLGDRAVVILRMNIEGAEYDVLKDLVETGLAKRIGGYFGMWDDVSKIDLRRDREFRAFLAANGIHTFPFNGRDLRWRLRKRCIAYQLRTRIMSAAQRIEAQRRR